LLSACPQLKVIATSREILNIYGEQVYNVPPMSLPDPENLGNIDRLLEYESIQLFTQRARAVKPDFTISEENASSIAEICIRLDGLPLAIELAAARSNLYSPGMIRERLDNRLALLTSGSRDVPTRLQTLRGTFDWSYDLLNGGEQILFNRFSVFQGGRTVDSSEAVCAPGLSIDILDGLESLLNKNLLYQEQGKLGEPRFYMLETIHEYANEKLAASGEVEEIRQRHAEYFARLAAEAEREFRGPRQKYWVERLRAEYDNLRIALTWSLKGADIVLGSEIIFALRHYWYIEGSVTEGLLWVERALIHEKRLSPGLRAKVSITASILYFIQGDHDSDKRFARQAVHLSQGSGDDLIRAWALLELSKNYSASQDQAAQGLTLCDESLELFRDLDQGELSRLFGDYQRAEIAYQECLELSHQSGEKDRPAGSLANLSSIAMHRGDYVKAEILLRESLEMYIDMELEHGIGYDLALLSGPLAMQGRSKQAAVLLGASESILQTLGVKIQPADQIEIDRNLIAIHEQLDESSVEEAFAEGREMSIEEAVSFALDDQNPEHLKPLQ
jgi:non-specific serine/threonine protein kinase